MFSPAHRKSRKYTTMLSAISPICDGLRSLCRKPWRRAALGIRFPAAIDSGAHGCGSNLGSGFVVRHG
jgi:hypothetical protein